MSKQDRIAAFIGNLPTDSRFDPCYTGYFTCFNACEYYEAHDVLEHLWLKTTGGHRNFYKALIQLAGAFVHLQKQRARPDHPKDGRRLHPAVRLFRLAQSNLSPYPDHYLGLDLSAVRSLANQMVSEIEESSYRINPWTFQNAPKLHLILQEPEPRLDVKAGCLGRQAQPSGLMEGKDAKAEGK